MADRDESRRIITRRIISGGIPTIPVSLDHRNGDWITTDIYEGELYQDVLTGKVYTRHGTSILNALGFQIYEQYKVNISQASTNAPTIDYEFQDDFNGVWSYDSVGTYLYDTPNPHFRDPTRIFINIYDSNFIDVSYQFSFPSNTQMMLNVYNTSGVLTNGLMNNTSMLIEVAP